MTNAHDGPARSSTTRTRSSTTAHPEAAANEVVPSGRGTRQRGRQLTHEVPEEKVAEERLPQNTRFPPRSRNINTTPSAPEEDELKNKNRQRGKPQGQAVDSQVDETQVSECFVWFSVRFFLNICNFFPLSRSVVEAVTAQMFVAHLWNL